MSSENLHAADAAMFLWTDAQPPEDYVLATYEYATRVDGEQAALGVAREQSICATQLNDIEMPGDIARFCARVVSVEQVADEGLAIAPQYFLSTPVYSGESSQGDLRTFRTTIAYPTVLFGSGLTRLWNSVFGEVHRLGFLAAASLVDLTLLDSFASQFAGPRHGVSGIRAKLGVADRPIFCRSMRPASGLPTEAMLELNEKVLTGGFDVIKDDELTYHSERSPFAERVERMVAMKKRVEDRTGEKKLYFANIIDDIGESLRMADTAQSLGAEGVLLSPAVQGLSFISEVANRTDLIILGHNSCGDATTRSGVWGSNDAVLATVQRAAGADLVVSPGPFATVYQDPVDAEQFLTACRAPLGNCNATLPIVQGGKQPEHLDRYTRDVGSVDYMIIAATWLDNHPEGIEAGARAFRDGWASLAN